MLAAIHPPEATRAILECLGLPTRAPPVSPPTPVGDTSIDLEPRAALLPVLWEVQRARGFVDLAAEEWVGRRLGVSPAHVHGCVTFYTMFKQLPWGRYHIQVCTTLSCMLRGSDDLVAHLERRLGVKVGQTTSDGRFSPASLAVRRRPTTGAHGSHCASVVEYSRLRLGREEAVRSA